MNQLDFFFFIHINTFPRNTIHKAIARPIHAHMHSDQGYSKSLKVKKKVCPQTRLKDLK